MATPTLFELSTSESPAGRVARSRRLRAPSSRTSSPASKPRLLPADGTEELYTSLQAAYSALNRRLFDGLLPEVIFTLQRRNGVSGYFRRKSFTRRDAGGLARMDELAINPESMADREDIFVLQVLTHEMVHVWQAHHGTPSRAGYHNAEFAEKMEAVGLIPSSDGSPLGSRTGQSMSDYIDESGRFIRVAREITASGWTLPWDDTFARGILTNKKPIKLDDYSISIVTDSLGQVHTVIHAWDELPLPPILTPGASEPAMEVLPAEIRQLLPGKTTLAKETVVVYFQGLPLTIRRNIANQPKRISRHKFKCPRCDTTAWAKEGAGLMCARHQCLMPSVGVV